VRWLNQTLFRYKRLRFLEKRIEFVRQPEYIRWWLFFLIFLGLILLQFSLSGQVEDPLDQIFVKAIQPLLLWGVLFCLLAIIETLISTDEAQLDRKSIWISAGIIFFVFISLGLFLQLSGYGYTQTDRVYGNFDLTGYPILGYQVLIACLLAALSLFLLKNYKSETYWKGIKKSHLVDLVLSLGLFFTALIIWRSFPVQTHMFYDQPRPPNYEYYPNSDSNLYDRTALNLITAGKIQTYTYRYEEFVGRRPLLVIYLAGLHKIAGPNYPDISSLQVIIFSLQPVLVYFLAKALHSRSAGVLASSLIIFREWNGLRLSDTVTGVHSQLLLSEIPAMIMLVLFLVVLIRAIREEENYIPRFLTAGGVLGLAMLIRQEVGILFPFISWSIFWDGGRKIKQTLGKMILILAGMILVITPWVSRNWRESGKLILDLPSRRVDNILEFIGIERDWWKFNLFNEEDQSRWLDQAPDSQVLYENNYQKNSGRKIHSIVFTNKTLQEDNPPEPKRIELIANHFTNNLVQTVVYLPSYPLYTDIDFISKMMIGKLDRYYGGIFFSPNKYVKVLPYWWTSWSGKIPVKSLVPVAVNVFIISFGITAAKQKDRKTAYLPLLAYLGYVFIYSVERASGGRFLQEMDWVSLLYLSIGLVAIIKKLLGQSENKVELDQMEAPKEGLPRKRHLPPWINYGIVIAGLFFIGAVPVMVESRTQTEFPDGSLTEITEKLLVEDQAALSSAEQLLLRDFLLGDAQAIIGSAYYPRYFDIGENLRDVRAEILGKMPQRYSYQRTEFYLIGTDTNWVVLPRFEVPGNLPHGSEVFALGCQQDGVLDALVVILLDDEGTIRDVYWRDGRGNENLSCPLLWPGDEQISTILQDYDEPQKMKIW